MAKSNQLSTRDKQLIEQQAIVLEQLHKDRTWNEPQKRIFRAAFGIENRKRFFLRKGRKGGGTECILYPVVRIASLYPNRACYIIGPTATLEREIIWNNGRLRAMFPPEWIKEKRVIFNEKDARAKLWNGSFIRIMGADHYSSMVGIEGDVFVFDEGADHDPRAYKNCYPNILSRDAWWFFVSAPPIENIKSSFMYEEEQRIRNDPDWFFYHWSTYENAQFLPGGTAAIDRIRDEHIREGNEIEFIQRYLARYVLRGKGSVLPNFIPIGEENSSVYPHEILDAELSADKHKLQWWTIYDPGYATCFCVLYICYNPYSGEIFLLDEVYETDRSLLSANELWPRIRRKEKVLWAGRWRRVYDSAAPGFPQEIMSRWKDHPEFKALGGFQPTIKESGDEDKYFKIMNTAFKLGLAKVSDRCVQAAKEFENYTTTEMGTYPDKSNHALDDFRYFLKAINYNALEKAFRIIAKNPDEPEPESYIESITTRNYDNAYSSGVYVPKPDSYLSISNKSTDELEQERQEQLLESVADGSYGRDYDTDYY